MRPGRYIGGQPSRRESRYADDRDKPTEAEPVDEPDAADEPPAWAEERHDESRYEL
jgi:hypothetical protein